MISPVIKWLLIMFLSPVAIIAGVGLGLFFVIVAIAGKLSAKRAERIGIRAARKSHRAYARREELKLDDMTPRQKLEACVWENAGRPADNDWRRGLGQLRRDMVADQLRREDGR